MGTTGTHADIPDRLCVDFEIFDPGLTDPVDRFQDEVARLAAIGPVVYSGAYGGHWVVTGYHEAREVLRDPERFSSFHNDIRATLAEPILPLKLDPPEHTAYRHALQALFGPPRMRSLEPDIRSTANELLDGFAEQGSAEFVAEFAHELPARMFLRLLDLPLGDAPPFVEASDTLPVGSAGTR